jgi:hypothetical protein
MPRKINPLETNTMARAVVAGELKNLGYHVSISKNPMLTKSPSGIEFNLVVHGQRSERDWPTHNPNGSHYVFAYLPLDELKENQFFVLTKEQTQEIHNAYQAAHENNGNKTRGGFGWRAPHLYRGCWANLPK